jgi:hypothetical protein
MSTEGEDFLDFDIASDRAGVISMVALFEDILGDAIRDCLVPLSNDPDKALFGDRGPLATFSAKIDFAFALGMYGAETRAALHNIRRIRNCFAHRHEAKTFEFPRVQELCRALPRMFARGDASALDDRAQFNRAIIAIGMRLESVRSSKRAIRPVAPSALP